MDLPKNAQGFAASAIAKGADPASVFQSLVVPDDPPVADEPVDDTGDVAPPDDPAPVTDDVVSDVQTAEIKPVVTEDPAIASEDLALSDVTGADPIAPPTGTSAEAIALALLQEAEEL